MEKSAVITFRAIGTQEGSLLYHFGAGPGRRDFHVTPQSASPTAPSGSGPRVQVGDFTKKGHPESGWPLERKTRLELATPTLARSCSTN